MMTKYMLPREGFAIEGKADEYDSWKLFHHKVSIFKALKGKLSMENTVDWFLMSQSVELISPGGFHGQRVKASAEEIIAAANHLAAHYRHAGKPVPDILQALI